ncbi:MAG: hypothetical protein MUF47_09095 [Porphyrobacter sp.]|nr:hypothetical protein [Porphyrobacter sp.]
MLSIWNLWTDPDTWGAWDGGLKHARSDEPLGFGTKGVIVPLAGPEARFAIVDWQPHRSYRFSTRLPLARLIVDRAVVKDDPVTIRHTVWFEGLLAPLWSAILGPGFRRALPSTLARLTTMAEAEGL